LHLVSYLLEGFANFTPTQCKKIWNTTPPALLTRHQQQVLIKNKKTSQSTFIIGLAQSTCDWSKISRGFIGVDPHCKAEKIL
jgi:hypothetical protein